MSTLGTVDVMTNNTLGMCSLGTLVKLGFPSIAWGPSTITGLSWIGLSFLRSTMFLMVHVYAMSLGDQFNHLVSAIQITMGSRGENN